MIKSTIKFEIDNEDDAGELCLVLEESQIAITESSINEETGLCCITIVIEFDCMEQFTQTMAILDSVRKELLSDGILPN